MLPSENYFEYKLVQKNTTLIISGSLNRSFHMEHLKYLANGNTVWVDASFARVVDTLFVF